MRTLIDFAPPPPKDAPKKEHREYNKMVRKAYANARKADKKSFKEALKKAKNGDAEAMRTVYFAYASQKKHIKAQFWREKAIENGISFSREPGSLNRPEPIHDYPIGFSSSEDYEDALNKATTQRLAEGFNKPLYGFKTNQEFFDYIKLFRENNNQPKIAIGDLEVPYKLDLSDLNALEVEAALTKKVAETTKGDEEKIKKIIDETISKNEN